MRTNAACICVLWPKITLSIPLKGGENAFVFLTQRYTPIPLVVRGYGAGVEVTAAGVFADILKTVEIN